MKRTRLPPTQVETGESYLERCFQKVVITYRIPSPRREYPFGAYSLDFAWPKAKVCVELDGNQHKTPKAKLHDQQKDALLKSEGWEVLRADRTNFFTPVFARKIVKALRRGIQRNGGI